MHTSKPRETTTDVINGKLGNDATLNTHKKDTDNNLYEFPNWNLEQRAQAARKQYTQGMRSYGQRGDKVFDSRGVILNNNQIKKTLDTYQRTGVLDFPPVVMKLSRFQVSFLLIFLIDRLMHL